MMLASEAKKLTEEKRNYKFIVNNRINAVLNYPNNINNFAYVPENALRQTSITTWLDSMGYSYSISSDIFGYGMVLWENPKK